LKLLVDPKTDWNEEDYYNFGDLNRVETNTQLIAQYLHSLGYVIPLEAIITNRTNESIDYLSSINRVERNLDSIRTNMITPPGYETMKVWNKEMGFDYTDANRLENNLVLLYEWAIRLEKSMKYCGTFNCGEDVI